MDTDEKRLEKIMARLAYAEAKLRWLPIDTAPKDGTRILVFAPQVENGWVVLVWWQDDLWIDGDMVALGDDAVTHWMPLPEKPQ